MGACASATGVPADARSGTSSTITTGAGGASIAANSTAVVGPRQLDTLRRFADAPFGMGVVRSLAVIAVAGWLGIMAFVSFGVAPRIFRTLDRAVAGEAVAAILPRYYDWGLVLCGVALAGCVFQVLAGREGWLRPLIGAALCGLMCGLVVWASTVALPRAEAAALILRRGLDDLLEGEAHLLARPCERQRGRLVAAAPHPGLGDVAEQGRAGRPGGGELLERRSERQPRDVPRETQQPLLCGHRARPRDGRRASRDPLTLTRRGAFARAVHRR